MEQNFIGVSAVMLVFFYSRLGIHIHMTRHRAAVLRPDVIRKTGSTQFIAFPQEKDRVTAIINIQKIW